MPLTAKLIVFLPLSDGENKVKDFEEFIDNLILDLGIHNIKILTVYFDNIKTYTEMGSTIEVYEVNSIYSGKPYSCLINTTNEFSSSPIKISNSSVMYDYVKEPINNIGLYRSVLNKGVMTITSLSIRDIMIKSDCKINFLKPVDFLSLIKEKPDVKDSILGDLRKQWLLVPDGDIYTKDRYHYVICKTYNTLYFAKK